MPKSVKCSERVTKRQENEKKKKKKKRKKEKKVLTFLIHSSTTLVKPNYPQNSKKVKSNIILLKGYEGCRER